MAPAGRSRRAYSRAPLRSVTSINPDSRGSPARCKHDEGASIFIRTKIDACFIMAVDPTGLFLCPHPSLMRVIIVAILHPVLSGCIGILEKVDKQSDFLKSLSRGEVKPALGSRYAGRSGRNSIVRWYLWLDRSPSPLPDKFPDYRSSDDLLPASNPGGS
jgi:hypothetical protein